MADGRGLAPSGPPAACAYPDAGSRDDLIELSWRVSEDGPAVVAMCGDLDLATADRTVRFVSDVVDRHGGRISADLSGVAFCDACGLGALIRIAAYAEQAGRRLEMANPSRAVARIMRITGLGDRLLMPALAGLAADPPDRAAQHG